MLDVVVVLADVFDVGLVGHEIRCPDLAMRMRIRAAHHCAFVLKDLHPFVASAQFRRLFLPPNPPHTIRLKSIEKFNSLNLLFDYFDDFIN